MTRLRRPKARWTSGGFLAFLLALACAACPAPARPQESVMAGSPERGRDTRFLPQRRWVWDRVDLDYDKRVTRPEANVVPGAWGYGPSFGIGYGFGPRLRTEMSLNSHEQDSRPAGPKAHFFAARIAGFVPLWTRDGYGRTCWGIQRLRDGLRADRGSGSPVSDPRRRVRRRRPDSPLPPLVDAGGLCPLHPGHRPGVPRAGGKGRYPGGGRERLGRSAARQPLLRLLTSTPRLTQCLHHDAGPAWPEAFAATNARLTRDHHRKAGPTAPKPPPPYWSHRPVRSVPESVTPRHTVPPLHAPRDRHASRPDPPSS